MRLRHWPTSARRRERSVTPTEQPRCGATGSLSIKLSQQGARVFQVRQVEALGEPVVNRSEQVTSFRMAPHILPQTSQAGCSPQLPGFGPLVLRNVKTAKITLLRGFGAWGCSRSNQIAFYTT